MGNKFKGKVDVQSYTTITVPLSSITHRIWLFCVPFIWAKNLIFYGNDPQIKILHFLVQHFSSRCARQPCSTHSVDVGKWYVKMRMFQIIPKLYLFSNNLINTTLTPIFQNLLIINSLICKSDRKLSYGGGEGNYCSGKWGWNFGANLSNAGGRIIACVLIRS